MEHFSKDNEILVVSDTPDRIQGARVEQIFVARGGIKNLRRIRKSRRLIREFDPDIVHGHYLTVGGLYAALSGGKRIVGSAWGSDIYYGPRRSIKERLILKYVLRKCDLIFAGTQDMSERVRDYGYKGEMAIFRFGVDPSVFKKTAVTRQGEFRILSIRPCSRIYNPLVIVEAFKSVLPQMGGATLSMYDFGNMTEEVHSYVSSDERLRESVIFISKKQYNEMINVYNNADIAVSIPNSDSAAASVLEAMACELPVIASDIPPMREWIEDGVNGYLTPIDSQRLADKIRKAYSMRAMLGSLGRRAREKILDARNQGTFDANIKVAEEAYKRLLSSS